jgi:hypothetical protein
VCAFYEGFNETIRRNFERKKKVVAAVVLHGIPLIRKKQEQPFALWLSEA